MDRPENQTGEADFLFRRGIWRENRRLEFLVANQPLGDTRNDAPDDTPIDIPEPDISSDTFSSWDLDHVDPKLGYAKNHPIFWEAFLGYVTSTRRKPDTMENLMARFYSDGEVKRHIVDVLSPHQSMDMVLLQCLDELNPVFILIEQDDHYSIFPEDQLPQNVPKGGIYDLPIDAYLRLQDWDTLQVKKIHNKLTKYIKGIDPSFIIQSNDYEHDIAKGYRMGILTVGSLVAFIERFSIGHIRGISDSTPDLVLQTLKADKRVYQPTDL